MTRDQHQVHRWLRKWQKRLLLNSWRFEVEFSSKSVSTPASIIFATVSSDPPYLTWFITVHPEFWTLNTDERERRLLHELIHGPTEALAQMAMRAVRRKKAIREDVSNVEESLVEWFTNVLWHLR